MDDQEEIEALADDLLANPLRSAAALLLLKRELNAKPVDRDGMLEATLNVIQRIQAVPGLGGKMPPKLLDQLTGDLQALKDGDVSPRLKRAWRPNNRRQDPLERRLEKTRCSIALQLFIWKRVKEKKAAGDIAKRLGREKVTATTVIEWRTAIMGGDPSSDETRMFYELATFLSREPSRPLRSPTQAVQRDDRQGEKRKKWRRVVEMGDAQILDLIHCLIPLDSWPHTHKARSMG